MITIYRGEGASANSLKHTARAFRPHQLQLVDASFFSEPGWETRTSLIVMPGGRDVPYHAALSGERNRRIANFVHEGGNYLGICAGAYYGCAAVEFEKGGLLEVCAARELAFFPGKSVGPAYGPGEFVYESEAGARRARIAWQPKKASYEAYYNGGCLFEAPEQYTGVTVLGRYQDLPETPAALIRCAVGKGQAILCGVHPEYPPVSPLWKNLISLLIKN